METRTVVLYGQSMLLSLMAASLSHINHLCIVQADSWEQVESEFADQPPDVLFFDLPSPSEGHILSLMYAHPHLLLIGLDVETNRAILLTGQATGSLTLERIIELVQESSVVDLHVE